MSQSTNDWFVTQRQCKYLCLILLLVVLYLCLMNHWSTSTFN
jgi:hypothetical protein